VCKNEKLTYLSAFKGEVTTDQFGKSYFGIDGIHLKKSGVEKMKRFMKGAAALMLDHSTPRK
jgi:hypothetical protein